MHFWTTNQMKYIADAADHGSYPFGSIYNYMKDIKSTCKSSFNENYWLFNSFSDDELDKIIDGDLKIGNVIHDHKWGKKDSWLQTLEKNVKTVVQPIKQVYTGSIGQAPTPAIKFHTDADAAAKKAAAWAKYKAATAHVPTAHVPPLFANQTQPYGNPSPFGVPKTPLFGNPTQQQPGGLFGNAPQSTGGLFGNAPQSPGGLFEQPGVPYPSFS